MPAIEQERAATKSAKRLIEMATLVTIPIGLPNSERDFRGLKERGKENRPLRGNPHAVPVPERNVDGPHCPRCNLAASISSSIHEAFRWTSQPFFCRDCNSLSPFP